MLTTTQDVRSRWIDLLTPPIIMALCAGCSKTPSGSEPTTFPVTGQVVDSSGQPLTAGTVEFQSTADKKSRAVSEIAADGSFSLSTLVDGQLVPGAIEGPHQVSIHPYQTADRTQTSMTLSKPRTVERNENHFELTFGRARK